ncbi:CDGSH iron-sulfur domain-containing protein [Zobellia laminariae]|uniref:CDGSH iron-sulfur domain-containing protein n=1 Tax=Zobellia laminariae TaxID=248906 RepID=UPI0034CDEAC7
MLHLRKLLRASRSRQKGYLLHFSKPKQSKTRISRIDKNTDRIFEGYGLNDCTCGRSKRMPNCDGSHKN